MVRNCAYPSKCRKCRPDCRTKHATALHDYYVKPDDETLGVAEAASSAPSSGSGSANDYDVMDNRKIDSADKREVLLRACAVQVINPDTKKSTLAYAQLDTASQATLISERLCNELGLKRNLNASTAIRTLGDFTTKCNGHSDFDLTSLADGKTYGIKVALIVSNFEMMKTLYLIASTRPKFVTLKGYKFLSFLIVKVLTCLSGNRISFFSPCWGSVKV